MASGSIGGGYRRAQGGGGRAGRTGAGRYTAARGRRIGERYRAPSRANRRGGGAATAVPSRWLM